MFLCVTHSEKGLPLAPATANDIDSEPPDHPDMTKIGMLTIGQSPRDDIIPPLKEILGPDHEILEAGALDAHAQTWSWLGS